MSSSFTFATWTASLAARGWTVLSPSHAVPISLWLRSGDTVLHLSARGTRVVLRKYAGRDLLGLVLRPQCDCTDHPAAGTSVRLSLASTAVPLDEVVLDGAAAFGWTSYEAGLLDVPTAAGILESLLARLAVTERVAV